MEEHEDQDEQDRDPAGQHALVEELETQRRGDGVAGQLLDRERQGAEVEDVTRFLASFCGMPPIWALLLIWTCPPVIGERMTGDEMMFESRTIANYSLT